MLGIGPDTSGPLLTSVTAFLPGALKDGELINHPAGELEFGTNPLPAIDTVTGDRIADPGPGGKNRCPRLPGRVTSTVPGAYIDSGGMYGTVPPNEV